MTCNRRDFLKGSAVAALLPFADLHRGEPVGLQLARAAATATLPTLCGMCRWRCPLMVHLENGRLAAIDGNPGFSPTGGRCCAKAKAAGRLLTDPARLRYPYKRVGKRGEGRWQRIDWGEAIDTVAGVLGDSAPDDLLLYAGGASSRYITELWGELGGRIVASSLYCTHDRHRAATILDLPAERPDCLVVLGGHLGENVTIGPLRTILDWQAAGTTLVVVDPRCSTLAARADHHLMARPGTDEVLLFAWMRLLIGNRATGDELGQLASLVGSFDVATSALLAGVDEDEVRTVGRLLARGRGAVRCGTLRAWYGGDHRRLAAVMVLDRLARGDIEGLFVGLPEPVSTNFSRRGRIIGCWGQNPLQAHPDPYRTMRALKEAEFVFACDILPGESTLYADIVFPEAVFLERTDTFTLFSTAGTTLAGMPFPVLEPDGEGRDPYWIVQQLAVRLGRADRFGYGSVMERIAADLAPYGVGPALLLERDGLAPVTMPATDAGTNLLEESPATLLQFRPPPMPPPGYARLLSGRDPVHAGTITAGNDWLLAESPANALWLNDRVARAMRLADGDIVFLENQAGVRSFFGVRILVTPGIRPDCVYLPHGFGCFSSRMARAFGRGVADGTVMTADGGGLHTTFVRLIRNGRVLDVPMLDRPPASLPVAGQR